MKTQPALILDLDGTVRESKTGKFISGPGDIEIIDGVVEQIEMYKNDGYLILGCSNQGGVAAGFKTAELVEEEMVVTQKMLPEDLFDDIRWCYFLEGYDHKEFGYKSLWRKPYIGILCSYEQYFYDMEIMIDWDKSKFVGDRPEDKFCAVGAGIEFVHIKDFLKGEETDVASLDNKFRTDMERLQMYIERNVPEEMWGEDPVDVAIGVMEKYRYG